MDAEIRKRFRRAMLARKATSPKLRGQYKRAMHAARTRDAQTSLPLTDVTNTNGGQQPPHSLPAQERPFGSTTSQLSSVTRRKLAIIVFAAVLPLLVLAAGGAWAFQFVGTLVDAGKGIYRTPVPRGNQIPPDDGGNGISSIAPTNTPNQFGVIEPLPTAVPLKATVPPDAPLPRFDRQEPFTILMIGVDSRDGGTTDTGADYAHSDTLILAYVDPLGNHINLLSVPRDLLVQQPSGLGGAKITDVYANGEARKYRGGGIGLVRDTLEQNFGIRIDYFAQVDFNGFTKIIETIGGVTVDNPYPIKDDSYPTADYQFTRFSLPAGVVHLNGDEALQYARTRHGDNDFARNGRQQQVILAIREQAVKSNLFANAAPLIATLGQSVQTDFPPDQWLPFASFAKNIHNDSITQYSFNDVLIDNAPGPVPGTYYAGLDRAKAGKIIKDFSTPKVSTDAAAAQVRAGGNLALNVVVENGTTVVGMAKHWSDTLANRGYHRVGDGFIDATKEKKGNVPKTLIYCAPANASTASAIAKTMGLDASAVNSVDTLPAEAPSGTDMLIVLGKDAKDPSG